MRTRPLLASVALAAAAVLPAAAPAAAHGDTVHLEISGAQNGHVTTVATFENDRDPVTKEFAGTLSATSADGRTVGPWPMVAVPEHPGTYTTRETLPAGHWRITVDCAFPSLGHGERELDVDAAVISDPTSAMPSVTATPVGPPIVTPTVTPTGSSTAGPAVPPSATPTGASPTVRSTTPASSSAPDATQEAAHETTSDATTWAAVGTAAAAVLLVVAGFWLRRRNRR
ncbi:hypothetical protein F7Q99_37560 [Streptomyces kaniharaensis]|uniref:LPXTG cell wall anchor domain-containing protein n=1 Tax=Streptomyces kaniharaensis TaxID=212423 RepID=A0A6N7L4F6_9ACTN|nr:hypothetical protein [Streptomyces kaniharaensis]MQS17747.1 hypothetical protein [Streptomyces kaniharaensis]